MQETPPSPFEFNLADVLRRLWRMRGALVSAMVVCVLLAGVVILIKRIADYERRTEYVIQFRFEGRSDNQYPNGSPFSLGDIVAPGILASVYEEEKVADQGVSFPDFQSAISIGAYTPDRRLIIERYNQSMDSRKATVVELRELQDDLQRELSADSARYAVLRYSDTGFGIPQDKISAILLQIAKTWEKVAIDTRGVLELDIRTVPAEVFDPSTLNGLERLNALKTVRANIAALRTFVNELQRKPSGNLVRDAESGNNVSSLLGLIDRALLQVLEVPSGWAEVTTNVQSEALGLPINLYSDRLFNASELDNLDYLIALDLVRQRSLLVRDNVRRILAVPFGDVALDPETKLSARDIDRLLIDFEDFTLKQLNAPVLSLGIAKNPEVVRLYYTSRLQELRRDKAALDSKARVLAIANQSYQGLISGAGEAAQPGTTPGFPAGSSTVIPQIGDAFIDRLIELTQKGGDTEFRQKLLEETVDFQQQSNDIETEISRIGEYIRVFSEGPTVPSSAANEETKAFFIKELNTQLPMAIEKLKGYAEVTQRIVYRLRFATDIHSVTNTSGTPAVDVDFYLRDALTTPSIGMNELLAQLSSYATIANRLYGQLNTEALGNYQTLFSSTANPSVVQQPLVTRYELLLLALAAAAGFLIALIAGFGTHFLRTRLANSADE